MIRVLYDDELSPCQAPLHLVQVGQADRRVRARNPNRLELAFFQGAEHLDGGQSRLGADRLAWPAPECLDLPAMLRVLHRAIAGKMMRQETRFTAAHRVRLAGERERAGAGLADL